MKKRITAALLLSLLLAVLTSCGSTGGMKEEYQINNAQLERFQRTQPIPKIDYSATRAAVIKRIVRFSDPNKISYVYLLSDTGVIISFYSVKGSVESKRSYLSPVLRPVTDNNSESAVVDAPDIDGTYGDNKDSVFFFTTEDVYVEWPGLYLWADQPLKLTTQPILIYTAPLK